MRIVPAEMVENAKVDKIPEGAFPNNVSMYTQIINDMLNLAKVTNGIGLSAIQVGLPINLFIAYSKEKNVWKAYFNASYCPTSPVATYNALEGCLTYPNEQYTLPRYYHVFVEWEELNKDNVLVKKGKRFSNDDAQALQHEIDHCQGKTIKLLGKRMV